jgi:hypothetical protein
VRHFLPLLERWKGDNYHRHASATYLYQFSHYVQWPSETFTGADAPLVIGVLGPDPFGGVLDEIARTKQVEGHPIVVTHVATMAEYRPCHILFISVLADPVQIVAALEKLRNLSLVDSMLSRRNLCATASELAPSISTPR